MRGLLSQPRLAQPWSTSVVVVDTRVKGRTQWQSVFKYNKGGKERLSTVTARLGDRQEGRIRRASDKWAAQKWRRLKNRWVGESLETKIMYYYTRYKDES